MFSNDNKDDKSRMMSTAFDNWKGVSREQQSKTEGGSRAEGWGDEEKGREKPSHWQPWSRAVCTSQVTLEREKEMRTAGGGGAGHALLTTLTWMRSKEVWV